VYWHRDVRVATSMIKEGLYRAMTSGLIAAEDLYGHTDESFYASFGARNEPPFSLIGRVRDRRLYVSAADIAFDETNAAHLRLQDLAVRARLTERLRELAGGAIGRSVEPYAVIIDVPEPVSFEVTFPVIDGNRILDYPEAGTVFTRAVIDDFVRTLRRIRLILEPGIAASLSGANDLLVDSIESA
jgi:hypothetical protein